jgi:deoxycytidylate deaminase
MCTFKKRSLELAEKASFRTRHGAVVVYNGHIIGSGYNVNLQHPDIKQFNELKTLHAEMSAIFRVKNKKLLKKAELYVGRLNKAGEIVSSRPCPVCRQVMRSFGVSKVHYTTNEGKWKSEIIE